MKFSQALEAFEALEAAVQAARERLDYDEENTGFIADFSAIGTPMAAVASLLTDAVEDNARYVDRNAEHHLGVREMV